MNIVSYKECRGWLWTPHTKVTEIGSCVQDASGSTEPPTQAHDSCAVNLLPYLPLAHEEVYVMGLLQLHAAAEHR